MHTQAKSKCLYASHRDMQMEHISEGSDDARQRSGRSHSSDQEHKKRREKGRSTGLSAQRIRERKLMETEQLKQEVLPTSAA